MKSEVSIYLDKRRIKKDGTYPVKLKVYYDGHRKYYATGYHLSEEDYSKTFCDNPKGKFKTIHDALNVIRNKSQKKADSLSQFSFRAYEDMIKGTGPKVSLVIAESFDQYMEKLRSEERISSANSYQDSKKAFFKFIKEKTKLSLKVKFGDIRDSDLERFELHMLKQGKSSGTIGIYMRNLRRLYNRAINTGALDRSLYPFGKDKYIIPQTANNKKAMTLDQIRMIYNYPCKQDTKMKRYIDYFFFSFYCKGMNLKDIAGLTWSDIDDDVLTFVRAKTKRSTKSNITTIEVELNQDAKRIIDQHGIKSEDPTDYVFPIWNKSMSADRKDSVKKSEIKNINNALKFISNALKIIDTPSFNSARHSWASIALVSGQDKISIQEGLGHQSSKTTDKYLKSLDSKSMQGFQDMIDLSGKAKMKVI